MEEDLPKIRRRERHECRERRSARKGARKRIVGGSVASISQALSRDGSVAFQQVGWGKKREKRGSEEDQAKEEDVPFWQMPEDRPSEGLPVDDKDDDGSHDQPQHDPHQDSPEDDQDGFKEEHEDLLPVKKSKGPVEGKLPAPFVEKENEGV